MRQLTDGLQEIVSEQVNEKWLITVPFFRGLVGPDGKQVVQPVEKAFLAKVAVALKGAVFAPLEHPPRGRCVLDRAPDPAVPCLTVANLTVVTTGSM